jgi:LysR family nitrogen assimilation transcriptional regulator
VEIVQLKNFIEVADRGSFTRAALVLGVNQPTLSRQIRKLELELHQNLLYRHGRGVVLTDAGERFACTARQVLQQLEQAAQGNIDSDNGRIVVGVAPTFARVVAVKLARAFSARFSPARLTIVEDRSCNLQARLLADDLDLALLHLSQPCGDLACEVVKDEAICLIEPKQSSEGRPDTVTLAEVAELPLIFPNTRNPVREVVQREAALAGLALDVTQEIGAVNTILGLVQNGYGYAVATAAILHDTPYAKSLQTRRIVDPALVVRLAVASHARRTSVPLQLKTAQLIKDVLTRAVTLD